MSISLQLPSVGSTSLQRGDVSPVALTQPSVSASALQQPAVSAVSMQLNKEFAYLPIIIGNPTISGTIEIGEVLTPTAAPVNSYPPSTRV